MAVTGVTGGVAQPQVVKQAAQGNTVVGAGSTEESRENPAVQNPAEERGEGGNVVAKETGVGKNINIKV